MPNFGPCLLVSLGAWVTRARPARLAAVFDIAGV